MSQSMLTDLGEIADVVSEGVGAEEKISALTKAFDLFSQETVRLESAYNALKQQFHSVNLQLEDTNRQLNAKVQELDLTTSYLNSILNNMSQGILFIDTTGMITTYNRAAAAILGKDTQKILFQRFDSHFTDDLFGFSIAEAFATGQAPDLVYATIEGTSKQELEVSASFVQQENEAQGGMIILFRDITEIRHLQMVTRRQDRLSELGEMAAAVAHEIRNPLGGIKGFALLLHRDLEGSESSQRLAEHIVNGSETLERLVSNVLNYSRPVQMQYELVDLNELIALTATLVHADANLSQSVTVEAKTAPTKLVLSIDKQLLQSALLNLIVNAIQASPEGSTVTMTLYQQHGQAIIDITDHGCGISEENLEKIFSPFFTTKAEGNGFGLAEVHKIIEAHDGEIDVSSTIDEGTTFSIKLPIG